MVARGAKGTDQEFAQVLDYLAKNLPPEADVPRRGPAAPPRGDRQARVRRMCR